MEKKGSLRQREWQLDTKITKRVGEDQQEGGGKQKNERKSDSVGKKSRMAGHQGGMQQGEL